MAGSRLGLDALAVADGPGGADDPALERLLGAGMASPVAAEKRRMLATAAKRLLAEGLPGGAAAKAFWVPGRIEIAGKHTDYAGGRSLLAATSRGFVVVSVDRGDAKCRIFTSFGQDRSRRESAELAVSPDLEPQPGHWSAYPAVVIRRLARNFGISFGADIAVECDLPESSGMSTSSAVVCYMWLVLSERNGLRDSAVFKENLQTDEQLYSYLGFIENGQNCGSVLVGDKGVGTFGGSEDHTAIMSCEPDKVKMFSYCPTKHEGTFEFPPHATFVVAVSGALAEKTGGAMADYNNAAFLARDAAAAWCRGIGGVQPLGGRTFVEGAPNLAEIVRHVRAELATAAGGANQEPPSKRRAVDQVHRGGHDRDREDEEVRAAISKAIASSDDGRTWGPRTEAAPEAKYKPGALAERFEQFFDESERFVPRIATAFADGELEALGPWADESHRQTVERLRNTVPETEWLPLEARRLGAAGASAFGAGFGGSCWALVPSEAKATAGGGGEGPGAAEAFAAKWEQAYRAKFPDAAQRSTFFVMRPGPGAFPLHQ